MPTERSENSDRTILVPFDQNPFTEAPSVPSSTGSGERSSTNEDLENYSSYLTKTDLPDVCSTMSIDSIDPPHARTIVYQHDTEWKDNPKQVDELISREMMQLSLESRNHIQDEIHGVGCMAPEETPELLEISLQGINHELENVIPPRQKQSYLQAKKLHPQSYVHGDSFKLRFLRFDLFDIPRAAVRMAYFMDLLLDIYGPYALERPIRLSDFTKHELCHFRKGRIQLLPHRDRGGMGTGRRIFFLFPDKEWEQIPPKTRHKIVMYQTWVAGNDPDTQRKGISFLAWFDPNSVPSKQPKYRTPANQLLAVRVSSVHVCTPDTPFFKLRRALVIMTAGKFRSHLRVHIGESTELRYCLQGYGFPSDKIPVTDTGSIKTVNLKKWMKLRHLEEDASNQVGKRMKPVEQVIYSPYLTDVIFRKGKSMFSHPGNVALRHLIKLKIENGDFARISKTRKFIIEVIKELKFQHANKIKSSKGMHLQNPKIRLLIWDEVNKDAWKEMVDEDLLYNKIRHVVKHFQKVFDEEKALTKPKDKNVINHEAATSIFLSQDGSTSFSLFCTSSSPSPSRAAKKQKVDTNNHGKTTSGSLECFGKSFLPFEKGDEIHTW